ncbi:hypothetical protein Hanom_Chr09g00806531 [Helianthus anomalus]
MMAAQTSEETSFQISLIWSLRVVSMGDCELVLVYYGLGNGSDPLTRFELLVCHLNPTL